MVGALLEQRTVSEAEDAERRARFPLGAAIEFADLELHTRTPVLDALRDAEPVSWVPALGGWLVTDHRLARVVLGAKDTFTVWAEPNLVRESLGVMMLTTDPPEHTRLRTPFEAPFRLRAVRDQFDGMIAGHVDRLLDDIVPRRACDLCADYAAPFAIGVAGDLLGLSLDDVARIQEFYDAFAGAMVYDGDPAPQRLADAARGELSAMLLEQVERSRSAPTPTITSAIANDSRSGLADDEIVAQLRVVLFGAIETVESMIVNAVLLLLDHPEQLAAVRDDPDRYPNAVEEGMRLVPPVAFVERWTTEPVTIGGVEIPAREFVGISTVAAGRDPNVFTDPLRYDVDRDNSRSHLAFSFGVHHCIGLHVARVQGPLAVRSAFDRLPELALDRDARPEPFGFAFRRPPTLPVRWRGG